MPHLLSRLSLKAQTKPIAYRICDLNRRVLHTDGAIDTLYLPLRTVRFHMGGVPYDMEIESGKDGERFLQRFYSAIDRKEHRRSVVGYGTLCERLLSTAIYEEDYARLIEGLSHHVYPERCLCVSENGFFRVALQLYLYLGPRIMTLESYDDGAYVRFVFRVDDGGAFSHLREGDDFSFRDAALLLDHKNSFLYRYLVHSAIAAGADLFAGMWDESLVFSLGVPYYDPTRFSFYGVGCPSAEEINEINMGAYQLFRPRKTPSDALDRKKK